MVCLRSKPRAAVRPPRERRQGRPKNICACGQTCSVTGAQAWARLQRLERLGGGIVELDLMRGETVQAVSLAAVTACAEIALLPDLLGDGGGWLVIAVVLLSLPLCNSQVTSSSMTTPCHPPSCTGRRGTQWIELLPGRMEALRPIRSVDASRCPFRPCMCGALSDGKGSVKLQTPHSWCRCGPLKGRWRCWLFEEQRSGGAGERDEYQNPPAE